MLSLSELAVASFSNTLQHEFDVQLLKSGVQRNGKVVFRKGAVSFPAYAYDLGDAQNHIVFFLIIQ